MNNNNTNSFTRFYPLTLSSINYKKKLMGLSKQGVTSNSMEKRILSTESNCASKNHVKNINVLSTKSYSIQKSSAKVFTNRFKDPESRTKKLKTISSTKNNFYQKKTNNTLNISHNNKKFLNKTHNKTIKVNNNITSNNNDIKKNKNVISPYNENRNKIRITVKQIDSNIINNINKKTFKKTSTSQNKITNKKKVISSINTTTRKYKRKNVLDTSKRKKNNLITQYLNLIDPLNSPNRKNSITVNTTISKQKKKLIRVNGIKKIADNQNYDTNIVVHRYRNNNRNIKKNNKIKNLPESNSTNRINNKKKVLSVSNSANNNILFQTKSIKNELIKSNNITPGKNLIDNQLRCSNLTTNKYVITEEVVPSDNKDTYNYRGYTKTENHQPSSLPKEKIKKFNTLEQKNQKKVNNKSQISLTVRSSINNESYLNNPKDKYEIGEILGKGAYGLVRLVTNKLNKEKYAMKIYDKVKLNSDSKLNSVFREIEILKNCNHENIVKLIEVINTKKQILIVQELIEGISLREYYNNEIRGQKGISEHKTFIFKKIFKQIFSAMNYLHKNKMAHRDIKLENIIINKKYEIKILDFGFGMYNPQNKLQTFYCGTPNYMAPEIAMKRPYIGQKADLWSLGVLVYKVFAADFPFKGKNEEDLYNNIKKGKFNIPIFVPEYAKKIICSLIEVDPKKRMTCEQVLDSSWLKD